MSSIPNIEQVEAKKVLPRIEARKEKAPMVQKQESIQKLIDDKVAAKLQAHDLRLDAAIEILKERVKQETTLDEALELLSSFPEGILSSLSFEDIFTIKASKKPRAKGERGPQGKAQVLAKVPAEGATVDQMKKKTIHFGKNKTFPAEKIGEALDFLVKEGSLIKAGDTYKPSAQPN